MSPTSRTWSCTRTGRVRSTRWSPSTTRSPRVTTSGAGALAGARQRTLGPWPENVPTGEDHSKVRRSIGVSMSVTDAVTISSSLTSARLGGSARRVPCAVSDATTGAVLAGDDAKDV